MVTQKMWVIRDGEKAIGIYDPKLWQLDMISFDPRQAREKLQMPPIYSWATLLGARLSTCVWWDEWSSTGDEKSFEFTGGGSTLSLATREKWKPEGKYKRNATSEYSFVLKLDPVFGYVWDVTTKLETDKGKNDKGEPYRLEFLNVQPANVSDPWPDKARYDLTIYTPDGTDKAGSAKYYGWANNLPAADRSDQGKEQLRVREGGFTGFFVDKNGWGMALARLQSTNLRCTNSTCNMWEDQHNTITLPDAPDDGGVFKVLARWRWQGVPPEIAKHIEQNAKINDFGGARQAQIRLGILEDFEDQPLPFTTTARGLWNWGFEISQAQAHSGKKSFLVKAAPREKINQDFGRTIAPFVKLDPNSTYRLEAWIFVEGEDTQAFISNRVSLEEKWIGKNRSESVTSKDGWKLVGMDIKTGSGGGNFDPRLLAVGTGRAFFDDFRFVKVEPNTQIASR
jgi:hypothetical protein